MVFYCLTAAGFMINLAKCEFLELEVKMLRFEVGSSLVKLYYM